MTKSEPVLIRLQKTSSASNMLPGVQSVPVRMNLNRPDFNPDLKTIPIQPDF